LQEVLNSRKTGMTGMESESSLYDLRRDASEKKSFNVIN
jgi:hypothetical protein